MNIDISMDIHIKSMDMDMDVKFHITATRPSTLRGTVNVGCQLSGRVILNGRCVNDAVYCIVAD